MPSQKAEKPIKAGDKIAIAKKLGGRVIVEMDVVDKIQGGKIKTKGGKEFSEADKKDNQGRKATLADPDFFGQFTKIAGVIEKMDIAENMAVRFGLI